MSCGFYDSGMPEEDAGDHDLFIAIVSAEHVDKLSTSTIMLFMTHIRSSTVSTRGEKIPIRR